MSGRLGQLERRMVVGVAVAAVLVTLLVASGPGLDWSAAHHARPPFPRRRGLAPRQGTQPVGSGQGGTLSSWMFWIMIVLLCCYLAALIALLVFGRLSRRRRSDTDAEDFGDGAVDWSEALKLQLSTVVADQEAAIRQGTPRNAIVACWLRFTTAASDAGVPMRSWETAHEFTSRALAAMQLDDRAVRTLGALFLEARFSEHDMTEAQRDQAIEALRTLAVQLHATSSEPVSAT